MKRHFKNAIANAGGFARISGTDGSPFVACLQPEGLEGNGHAETGEGYFKRFTLYIECNDTALLLQCGSTVEYGGKRYRIRDIVTRELHGAPVYRQGTAIMETEEEPI